jgi:predicted membrane-bound spermidine synthase
MGQAAEETAEANPAPTTVPDLGGWLLVLLVFVAGACSLAVEVSASRLLAPYFGTSLFVWANLIGLILFYLTLGSFLGGRLADRYPHPGALYTLTSIAAFLIGLIPLLARPILGWSQVAFATTSIDVFFGSLTAVILLFAVPMILLGCVSPYAIRLRLDQVGTAGQTAGHIYALSTAGSILGTFLPVLWLIPAIGTYRTFFTFAVALLLVSVVGLVGARPARNRTDPPGAAGTTKGRRFSQIFLALLLLIPMALAVLALRGPIKPAFASDRGGILLAERESAYNYIQVVQLGDETLLFLNDGNGVHSVYDPNRIVTGAYWDYFLVAPYFNPPPYPPAQLRRVALIGLGAGTAVRELTAAYGAIPIDGVEIDGTVSELARQYFHLNEPSLTVLIQDGRAWLATTSQQYDEIAVDVYQQPYVPFQFTTREFFQAVRDHLTPTGVVAVNVARTATDFRLVEALAQTMRAVFPNVYIVDAANFDNSVVVGTNAPTSLGNFKVNTAVLANPYLAQVAHNSLAYGHLREEPACTVWFTDDRAPVEQLIDRIIYEDGFIQGS